MAKNAVKTQTIPILAMLLAWLIPGAGHWYIGRRKRAIIIFLCIGSLFWTGIAVGGVMTVDYYNSRWWFIAQMAGGAHGLVGWYRQKQVYGELSKSIYPQSIGALANAEPEKLDQMLHDKGVALNSAPTENIARAYAGMAGMLNILCIVDALMLSLMGQIGEPAQPAPTPKAAES